MFCHKMGVIMPFCHDCGNKAREEDKYCQKCGVKLTHKEEKHTEEKKEEPKVVERVVEKEKPVVKEVVHHEKPRSSGIGGLITFLILLGIIGFIIFMVIQSGALDEIFEGSGLSYVDPCEREFNSCNHECGEGILSSICKEKCTYDYKKCKR